MAYIEKQATKDDVVELKSFSYPSKDQPEPFKKESELCDLFIREFNQLEGWTCYPEAAGFDVLVVHEDGRQIGVEAKLSLNAKVADQILPHSNADFFGKPGPDYRLVIVAKITDASAGIAKMLERAGVKVICPRVNWTSSGNKFSFDTFSGLLESRGDQAFYGNQFMFDWNPEERCRVPLLVTDLPAGVPSPIRLTPWKESALKVIALMRRQGYITAKQIAAHGISASSWTQGVGSHKAWLRMGSARGQWVETEHMPAFDKQHPEMYSLAVEMLLVEDKQTGFALA